ncbi:MBOAT family O-acyltransferase [Ruminococcus sp.]|uniref:MBOAT family O-acyltransferase n=1 Tax=Ruminococcus sp. TaxID=41978 RepID=UPI0025F5FCB9|nr:MBOAT family O-acyltransferase [Ruminococcus sp.]MBQ8965376.1 acyltransferase [Ruminococcus sp.]
MISLSFLYFFLPVFMALYLLLPKSLKSRLLLLGGIGLVCWEEPSGIIPVSVCILSGYLFGIFIHNFRDRKISSVLLALEVMLNAGVLLLFHRTAYDNSDLLSVLGQRSLVKSISAIGASVMPLHSISYCVDVYRKKYVCEHKFINVAEYIAFFPAFAAGPILRYDKMKPMLEEPEITADKCASGIRLLVLGLFTKLFISNTMLELWNDVRDIPANTLPVISAWIGMLAFAFFLYFELNAFSTIACGLASMMGFTLPRNSREPYKSHSFLAFCRKFNCSLYRWCMEYVFHSIKKQGKHGVSEFLAVIITVVVGSLWYSTSLHSLLFGAALILMLGLEKILAVPLKKLYKPLRTMFFVLCLLIIMPFMAFNEPASALNYIGAMFGGNHVAVDMTSEYLISTYLILFVLCLLVSSGVFGYFFRKKVFNNEYIQTIMQPVWVIALLIFCTAFLVSGNNSLYTYMF